MKTILVVTACLCVALALPGCKPKAKKAGDACKGDEASCLADKSAILECHDGKLVQMSCKGPKACNEKLTGATTSGRTVTQNFAVQCDFTGNPAGDTCTDES